MNYTLSYDYNPQFNCGVIRFNEHSVLIDFKDLFSIINFDRNFIHYYPVEKDYPYYFRHNQKISYLEHLFVYDSSNIEYIFKNNNKFDLRRENILIYHNFHKNISTQYNILDFKLGHYYYTGNDAYVMKNPFWKIIENGKEYWLMYCEKDTIIKLCQKSLDKIIEYENKNEGHKITFFRHNNGYISSTTKLYIHQIITGCYGNGKGTTNVSVDHIDQDPLNNTWENLRIATRKEQEQNSKGIKPGTKRERKHNAQDLPDGITQEIMKKYVCYYKDYADKDKKILREYFRVEKHPKLDKLWSTTKSNKITIQEKLAEANKVVDDLENDIYPEKEGIQLPKYVSLINTRGKEHLVFDKIHSDDRLNLKMVLPEEYDINEQIMLLKIKVKQKYGAYFIGNENIFNYSYLTEIDDKNKYVKKITFDIFRCFCQKKHTIEFENEKTERDAILEAEKWLSKNITEEYFNKYINYCDTEEQKKHYINYGVYCNCNRENYDKYKNLNKGQLLGGESFLDTIEKFSYNHIYLICGS
jgi:hypothetical protein